MQLTIEVTIVGTEDVVGGVQGVLTRLLARVELLDGLQEQTEAVVGQPLSAAPALCEAFVALHPTAELHDMQWS